jgi:hypothetical protein
MSLFDKGILRARREEAEEAWATAQKASSRAAAQKVAAEAAQNAVGVAEAAAAAAAAVSEEHERTVKYVSPRASRAVQEAAGEDAEAEVAAAAAVPADNRRMPKRPSPRGPASSSRRRFACSASRRPTEAPISTAGREARFGLHERQADESTWLLEPPIVEVRLADPCTNISFFSGSGAPDNDRRCEARSLLTAAAFAESLRSYPPSSYAASSDAGSESGGSTSASRGGGARGRAVPQLTHCPHPPPSTRHCIHALF